jgi:spoIIIJ-associated protein
MEKKQIEQKIGVIISELIEKMNFSVTIEIEKDTDSEISALVYNIKTSDSSFLIGQYGMNLQALQHIARIIARKKIADPINFILDVNSYRKEKNDSIIHLASAMADEACAKKETITMRPMTAYERRIIHLELSKNTKVKTQSVGDGEDRRISITPIID